MKILLTAINAKYIHSNLALRNFIAYTSDCSEHLKLAEYTINHSVDWILQNLYREKPDVLCISCYIWNASYVETITREFHKLLPQVPIWLGGPEVSFETERYLMDHPQITGIMVGEGEQTFAALARYYIYHSPEYLEDISGLCYRAQSPVQTNPDTVSAPVHTNAGTASALMRTDEAYAMSLDDIPFCYDDTDELEHKIVYYESSRGCPFRCSYCLSSLEKTLRFRSLELVQPELLFFVEHEIPQVKFVDRTFNCHHAHALEIWRYIQSIDKGLTNFHFEVSADLFQEDELALLQTFRPGLIQLEIGVQSTNPDTIKEIHRQMDLPRLKTIVKRIHRWGNIHMHLDLIAGLPYEDYASFARSFDEIYALAPSQLQLGFLKVLKGSYMYEHADEYELVYHNQPPYEVLSSKWLPYEDVLRIKRVEEMVEVYYNSFQYALTMKLVMLCEPSSFAFYQRLGDYYDKNGLFGYSHSRIARCQILRDFFAEELAAGNPCYTPELLRLLDEALVYDLYARENCKSRPDWAADLSAYKKETRRLDPEKRGKLLHIDVFHYTFPCTDNEFVSTLPVRETAPLFYSFDYTTRDPLNYQALITRTMIRQPEN